MFVAMSDPRQRDEEQRREALRTLETLRDSDTFATSALARTARRASDHFAARDATGPDGSVDKIELWGRRIGRGLSLAGLVALAIYLYLTYFAK
jgi:cytochrome c-type biogenesis protein CcmH/NrfG